MGNINKNSDMITVLGSFLAIILLLIGVAVFIMFDGYISMPLAVFWFIFLFGLGIYLYIDSMRCFGLPIIPSGMPEPYEWNTSSSTSSSSGCKDCNSTGRCQLCRGTGGTGWTGSRVALPNERCPVCLGSGSCRKCAGTGISGRW